MKIRFTRVWGMWNPGQIADSIEDNVAKVLIDRHVAEKVEDPPPVPTRPKPRKKRKRKP